MANNILIGPHISMRETLYTTIANNPYYVGQIYIAGRNITKQDKEATIIHCQDTGQRIYIHTHLYNNLAKNDARNSIRNVKHDLAIIKGLPGACVLHVGKACDQTPKGKKPTCLQHDEALTNIIHRLEELQPYYTLDDQPLLLLENAAGQGTELGTTWDDFRKIAEAVGTHGLGICLDTQHAFASGLSDFATYESANRLIDDALATGFSLDLIHLNDSKVPFNARVDRHESIGQGYIWKDSIESLQELILRCAEEGRSIVTETPTEVEDVEYILSRFTAPEVEENGEI